MGTPSVVFKGPAYSAQLKFDPIDHRYTCGLTRVPGVTDILGSMPRWIGEEEMEVYSDRGTEVHTVAECLTHGLRLPRMVFSDSLALAEKWMRLLDMSGWEVVHSECRVMSWRHWYAGTMDYLVRRPDGTLILVDLKSGAASLPRHYYQVVGYALAYTEEIGAKVHEGAVVSLKTCSNLPKVHVCDINLYTAGWLQCLARHNQKEW